MTRFTLFFLLLTVAAVTGFSQPKAAYRLFDKQGKEVDYTALLKKAANFDVVFFGEQHNNPIAHWLQLELTQDLFQAKGGKLILGAEMFERDNQLLLDEFLAGAITEKSFEEEARLWNNYATDYKPLVTFAKKNQLPFIATNVPRRYANLVFRKGLESLNDLTPTGKALLPPLPIPLDLNLPGYKNMVAMMGGHGGPDADNLPKAQAIKDACMGEAIALNLKAGHTFIHYNGAYHSDGWEGTVWYLLHYAPKTSVMTITTVEQDSLDGLEKENQGKADFTLVVAASMTKTY